MFSLTIAFGQGMWTLMFKDSETAAAAYAAAGLASHTEHPFVLTDDFGQKTCIRGSEIKGIMLENLEESKMAHIERALHQQRTQILAQKLSESDSAIRAARAQHGPAIINPVGGNGFGR